MLIEITDCSYNGDTQNVKKKKNPCGLLREHISAFLNKLPLESEQLVRMLFFFFLLWKIIHHILHYCSAPKMFAMTYDNKIFCIITTLLKALRHIPHKHSVN